MAEHAETIVDVVVVDHLEEAVIVIRNLQRAKTDNVTIVVIIISQTCALQEVNNEDIVIVRDILSRCAES